MKTRAATAVWPALFLLLAAGCAGDDSDSNGQATPQPNAPLAVTVPITSPVPLLLAADVPATTRTYVELPADFDLGQLTEATLDLSATLSQLTIQRTDGGSTPSPTVELSLRVAAGDDTVGACSGGTEALSAVITGDATFATKSVSPSEAKVPQSAIDVINTGAFTLCASAVSSVDAQLSLGGVTASFGFDDTCDPAQDLAGVWTGDYSCDNFCGGANTDSGQVQITIKQAGRTAIYWDDSGAVYVGSVCGPTFRHLGLGNGYFESGEFTRTGATTAVKSSEWVSTVTPDCGGTCADTLTLSSN